MKSITSLAIGQYYPAESVIHRLDPRVKIGMVLMLSVITLVVSSFEALFVISVSVLLVILLAGIPLGWIMRGLRPILFILTFTLLVHFLFTPGLIVFKLGFLKVTQEGLRNGLFVAIRLIVLVVSSSLVTFTSTPIQLTDGMEYLLKPLRIFKVPTYELALMMTIALRFIPVLLVEADKIRKAQMARGADFESGNLYQRARNLIALLVPLFISAFRRADELALAMESRGFQGGEKRTRMRELKAGWRDWLTLALAILFMTVALLVSFLR